MKDKNITETKKNFNEEAIFVDIKVTFNDGESEIIKFKGKLDNYSVDDDEDIIILNDLKTTSKKVDSFMGYKYYDFENSKYGGYVGSFQNITIIDRWLFTCYYYNNCKRIGVFYPKFFGKCRKFIRLSFSNYFYLDWN